MDAQVVRIAVLALLTHTCLLTCHPTPWRTYQPKFLPGPQFCPDTGRTVCTAVDYYPTDQIYHLLTSARSQVFNLTSLFVDERKGDVEPNMSQLPTQPSYHQDGYGNNQPPPGGRFSPAGRGWSTPPPPNERPSVYPQDRWRLVEPNQNQGPPDGRPFVINNDRQSRVPPQQPPQQPPPNQRRVPMNTRRQTSNGGAPVQPANQGNGVYNGNLGGSITPRNRIQIESHSNRGNNNNQQQQHGGNNYPPQQPIAQEPLQIQPPYTQQSIKGYNGFGPTLRPVDGNWKGSPSQAGSPQTFQNPLQGNQPRFNVAKRVKRTQDVEVACQVQSTYVPPRAALNDNSEWKYIINVPERDRRFSQVVRVDVCLTEGQPCSSRLSLPFGFESRCRQKYIKKKLLSLNPDGQGTSEDNFFIPSCCVCEITRQSQK